MTQPAFKIVAALASQRNAILMAFRWRADDGMLSIFFFFWGGGGGGGRGGQVEGFVTMAKLAQTKSY